MDISNRLPNEVVVGLFPYFTTIQEIVNCYIAFDLDQRLIQLYINTISKKKFVQIINFLLRKSIEQYQFELKLLLWHGFIKINTKISELPIMTYPHSYLQLLIDLRYDSDKSNFPQIDVEQDENMFEDAVIQSEDHDDFDYNSENDEPIYSCDYCYEFHCICKDILLE